ncbi:hypothetical protein [Bifidobacterium vespertilionis]|uniref:hypothetical protein n=1 Tax=Bifidobacterium vespertilionis TaxID=2562524 RepID=UPI001BDBFB69|nr:hypothetical protein [Bifidobacterium vespertilionis]MBT1179303.1 hypothetical protein [Bifidobacterium vespertilionis]
MTITTHAAWPRARSMAGLGALVAIAAFAQTASYLFAPPVRWSSLTVAAREGVMLPALIVAVAAALFGRAYRPGNLAIGRLCAGGPFRVLARQTIGCCIAVTAGYIVALAPLAVRTALIADYDGPDVPALLAALVTLASLTVAASVLGAVAASRWTMVALPLGMFAALVFGSLLTNTFLVNTGRSALLPAPIWGNDFPSPGWRLEPMTGAYRIAFFTVLATAMLAAGRNALDGEDGRRWARDLMLWPCAIMATVMAITPLFHPMPLIRADGQSPICSDVSVQVIVCMHPADRQLSGEVAAAASRVLELAPQPHVTVNEHFGSMDWVVSAETATFRAPSGGESRDGIVREVQRAVAESVAGRMQCATVRVPGAVGEAAEVSEPEDVLISVQQEIRVRLGNADAIGVNPETGEKTYRRPNDLSDALSRLTDAQFADWFARHRAALQSCTATEATVMPD